MATGAKTGLCRNDEGSIPNQHRARSTAAEGATLAVIVIRVLMIMIMPVRQAGIGKSFARLIVMILMMQYRLVRMCPIVAMANLHCCQTP